MKLRKWFWRLLPVLVGLGGVAFYYLTFLPEVIRSNERYASSALKSLTTAEADFRANDRDRNGVNDFWTADVAGLYGLRPNVGRNPPELRLIERGVAEADARPLRPLAPKPVPYHGYFFIALVEDDTLKGDPERFYQADTGGNPPLGKVHHPSKFGFCAYPAEYGLTGTFTFLVNENNTVFRGDTGGKPVTHFPDESAFPKVYSIRD